MDTHRLTPVHLTTQELARRWGVTTGHLSNLRHQGKGCTYIKPNGGRVLYPIAAVEAYEAATQVAA
jgi:hypothetical protein